MNYRTKAQWGGRAPRSTSRLAKGLGDVVLHHTVTAGTGGDAEVRRIQGVHMDDNGWDDIGYHFLIAGDGTVYAGRGWGVLGAHAGDPNPAKSFNAKSYGIALLGTYTDRPPTAAQKAAFGELVRDGILQGFLAPAPRVRGHGQVPYQSTACPGARTPVAEFAAAITEGSLHVDNPKGQGYWLVTSDGGVFNFGDAGFYGSLGDRTLAAPIVSLLPTPSGQGYWLIGADGGVFAFGDAVFLGGLGDRTLNAPVVSAAVKP